ncbi:hypothetical protein OH76DRAFT_44662 [Lentinus brumalis]|uniref:Secreted protein n=1 Tax=Lentinus brumalis TaxID=2498619 RepID=A0A371DY65_9APHY|nr:hypothetical protein OH76DRAFT_44662 [Polyporus brumalis]
MCSLIVAAWTTILSSCSNAVGDLKVTPCTLQPVSKLFSQLALDVFQGCPRLPPSVTGEGRGGVQVWRDSEMSSDSSSESPDGN